MSEPTKSSLPGPLVVAALVGIVVFAALGSASYFGWVPVAGNNVSPAMPHVVTQRVR
jgi:hypothetical protein